MVLEDFSFIIITISYPPTAEPYPIHDDCSGALTSLTFNARGVLWHWILMPPCIDKLRLL